MRVYCQVSVRISKRRVTKTIADCFNVRECFVSRCSNGWTSVFDRDCEASESEEGMLSFAQVICRHCRSAALAILAQGQVFRYWVLDETGSVGETLEIREGDHQRVGALAPRQFTMLSKLAGRDEVSPEVFPRRLYSTQVEINIVPICQPLGIVHHSFSFSDIMADVRRIGIEAAVEKVGFAYVKVPSATLM